MPRATAAGSIVSYRSRKPSEVYNIGGNCEKQNIDVVHLTCSILEDKLRFSPLIPNPGTLASRLDGDSSLCELIEFIADPRSAAHDFRYALDCSKIQKELDWEPERVFEEGLERTVGWYLENQDWVENVITGEYQEYYEKVYGND